MTEREKKILDEMIAGLPTGDAFDLAAHLGLRIGFAKWHPVTAGEILHTKKEIVVNENSKIPAKLVIAHELGHFLIRENKVHVTDAETFCDRFAERLLDLEAVQ